MRKASIGLGATALVVALAWGCSDRGGRDCDVGADGCECTGGGACDTGLTCVGGVCRGDCTVGARDCPCTGGGACDPGLTCVDDVCRGSGGDGDADADVDGDADGDVVTCDGPRCCWRNCSDGHETCGTTSFACDDPDFCMDTGAGAVCPDPVMPAWFDEMGCVINWEENFSPGNDYKAVSCPCVSPTGTLGLTFATMMDDQVPCDYGDTPRPQCPALLECIPPPANLDLVVVGAWSGGSVCDGDEVEFGWFLCPGGRVRGYSRFNTINFLLCGTYTASGRVVSLSGTATDTILGESGPFDYGPAYVGDTLVLEGACDVTLERAAGAVSDSDCSSSVCDGHGGGGSGPVDCGTDMDCGRCWYCDPADHECRYGGEDPNTGMCYRGWEPPE